MMDKPEKLSEQYGDFNHFHSTDYDHFFDKRIRNRGLSYYTNSKVENLICNNNTYSADVIGTESYQVRIKIENSVLTEISCTCPYHKETSKYCKHVYALLLTIQMQARRVDMIECIHQYTRNILDLVKEMDTTVKNNGKTLYPYEIEWFHKRQISYQETIKSSPKEYEQLKDFELFKVFKELNFSFHMLYDDFTELNERIKNNQQEIEMRRQEQQNPKIDTFTYTVDDSRIFDNVDNQLSNMDLKTLYQVKDKLKNSKEDTKLIDRAIKNRKKKDFLEQERLQKLRKQERIENRLTFGEKLLGVFLGSTSNKPKKKEKNIDYLMPWEQEEVRKGNYDPWNFEEEDLEEDDYYSEDDFDS